MQTTAKPSVEWPTLLVIAIVYATWGSVVWFHASLPWWLILALGSYAAALHTSLQHEVLHGHPTRSVLLNEALVFIMPTLWLPYKRYKDTHLAHHNNHNLTDPEKDPESYYMLPESWAQLGGVRQLLSQINHTLGGRMLLGPGISIVQFWSSELRDVVRGDRRKAKAWALFGIAAALTLGFVIWCGMPLWQYLLLIAYPGISLALVRSYCEHQAAEQIEHRTIIVECSYFWSLLFLNNNLHVPHHERPGLAWYDLPAYYRSERKQLIAQNNGYLMSYAEIFKRYFFSAKEPIAYPRMDWLQR
jgi:fatty acid desaturase